MARLIETENMERKIDDLLSEKPQKDPYKRFTILSYQLAGIGKSMRYSLIYPDQKKEHLEYLKTELSDLLIQTIIMAKLFDFDVNELIELGIQRLDEFKLRGRYTE